MAQIQERVDPRHIKTGSSDADTVLSAVGSSDGAQFDTKFSTTPAADTIPKSKSSGSGGRVDGEFVEQMGAASAGAAGSDGVVPAPAAGDQVKYLRGDKTWQAISDVPVPIHCISDGTNVLVKDGVGRFPVPASLNGFELVNVEVKVKATGGTSGATSVRVYNETDSVSMLSSNVTLDYNQSYVADGVVDTAHDDVATGDMVRVDVTAIPSGGAPSGLYVILTFREA